MPLGRKSWIAIVAVAGVLGVVVVGALVVTRFHRPLTHVAAVAPGHSTKTSQGGSPSTAALLSSPSPSPAVSPSPSPSEAAATAAPAGVGGGAAPPPPPPAYAFNPAVSGSGAPASTTFVAADLGGTQLTARFRVTAPGSVTLHGFGSIGGLVACLGTAGRGCGPGGLPNPAFWTITADDLAHQTDYVVVANVPGGGALDIGWNGSHGITITNLPIGGGCSSSTGYQAGCGVRFRVSASGSMTVNAATNLHLKVRDKASGTIAYDHALSAGSASFPLGAGSWTGYLYHEAAGPPSGTNLVVIWP